MSTYSQLGPVRFGVASTPGQVAAFAAEPTASTANTSAVPTGTSAEPPTPEEVYLTEEQVVVEFGGEGNRDRSHELILQTHQCSICSSLPLRYYMFAVSPHPTSSPGTWHSKALLMRIVPRFFLPGSCQV
ncbi:hypothetical protein M427DRAFT_140342 [Gonapodya prolifera JEL478]|uniref:Uncharacterized protein n=1 Tax=Gonapodya prolifera (strain JEL478) TaxID=1344416 RepID=A0A138ZZC4_GONPJ|nr:hypothetical protein M427DRAFT_140342 [Gonapodya prolifera JEL478]|eukprot:KXS09854.1 hypothetical protein M427DRAFT_140342 [Gonapodya prolifera JEL478]